jgi:signal transduction histidine kinase
MLRIKRQFDQLQASLKLREDMAAMIVHDMRSPLTPILGISELLLLKTDASAELLHDLKTIHSQAHRLNTFLNDMLILAKIDGGQLNLFRSFVDANQLVLTVEENYRLMAESREIKFVLHLSPQPRPLLLDANLFQRVLENLVSNALKFSPKRGTVTIRIEYLQQKSPQWPQLCLRVQDEGPGVPEEYRHKIFDKFSIVDLNQRDVTQVGLGLAFCKLVVEAHGGRIFVEANQPTGSIFVVEI